MILILFTKMRRSDEEQEEKHLSLKHLLDLQMIC